ncbi:hypothetical protein [Zavarzinia compransoris]|uniref:hypothetical protein n=1 Tax=Zavarzinia compransoris TaxID=1264899 RepID=UPI00105CDEBD|nr:hypothetical protein [Zavarzinia compransoris]
MRRISFAWPRFGILRLPPDFNIAGRAADLGRPARGEGRFPSCYGTMRTARARISGENFIVVSLVIAISSQKDWPPTEPARFRILFFLPLDELDGAVACCVAAESWGISVLLTPQHDFYSCMKPYWFAAPHKMQRIFLPF